MRKYLTNKIYNTKSAFQSAAIIYITIYHLLYTLKVHFTNFIRWIMNKVK